MNLGLESSSPLFGSDIEYFHRSTDKEAIQTVKPAEETSTLAFIFKEGVMIAVDSQASMGGYISSQAMKKIIEINPYMLCTMAGGAADSSFWHRDFCIKYRIYEAENNRRISLSAASKLLESILYSYHGTDLFIGTMIAGWNEKGPALYYVDSKRGRLKGTRFSFRSGSLYANDVLFKGFRYDMSFEEAVELTRKSIHHATFRDGASNGVASRPNGWKKLDDDDVGEVYKYPVMPSIVEQEMVEVAEE